MEIKRVYDGRASAKTRKAIDIVANFVDAFSHRLPKELKVVDQVTISSRPNPSQLKERKGLSSKYIAGCEDADGIHLFASNILEFDSDPFFMWEVLCHEHESFYPESEMQIVSTAVMDQLVWAFGGDNLSLDPVMFFSILAHEGVLVPKDDLAPLIEQVADYAELKQRMYWLAEERKAASKEISRLIRLVDDELLEIDRRKVVA